MNKIKLSISITIGVVFFVLFLLKDIISKGKTSIQNVMYFLIYGIAITLMFLLIFIVIKGFVAFVRYIKQSNKLNSKKL